MEAGPHGMNVASRRSRIRRSDLCTYKSLSVSAYPNTETWVADLCWISFSLDDVEDADVAACLARCCGHHAVLRLK